MSLLVSHQARDGCNGAPVGDSPASGAGHSFVALHPSLDDTLEQGAQRDFDLFYPELPLTTATTPTTVEVTIVLIFPSEKLN